MTSEFSEEGATEFAPLSTISNPAVAIQYAHQSEKEQQLSLLSYSN